MFDRSKVTAEIIDMLRNRVGRRTPVSVTTTFDEELGMFGDDAAEFMEQFFQRFPMDSSDFDFDAYFEREAWGCLSFAPRPHPKVQITVAHLVNCVESGRWLQASP